MVIRVWLLGMTWGTVCGIVSAWVYLAGLYIDLGSDDGSFGQTLMAIGSGLCLAGLIGAALGFLLGCVTGLAAGLVLAAMLRVARRVVAIGATIAAVLLAQIAAGVAFAGGVDTGSLWAYFVVPAITVIPLSVATLRVGRDLSTDAARHRDTLTA